MARNPSISLTTHQQEFVQSLVTSGRYHGVSEVVRAGLRLLEDEEERRDAERQRLKTGAQAGMADIEAGRVSDFDPACIIAKIATMQKLVDEAQASGESDKSLDDIWAMAKEQARRNAKD